MLLFSVDCAPYKYAGRREFIWIFCSRHQMSELILQGFTSQPATDHPFKNDYYLRTTAKDLVSEFIAVCEIHYFPSKLSCYRTCFSVTALWNQCIILFCCYQALVFCKAGTFSLWRLQSLSICVLDGLSGGATFSSTKVGEEEIHLE